LNDTDFVEGLRRKDAAAIRHLSECLLPSVWRFVYFRVKGDQHLAEDIVSDTVLALVKAAGDPGTEVLSPGAWLRTVATHKIQDHFRAAARVQHLIDKAASVVGEYDKTSEPSCQQECNEQRAIIRKVMDDLSEPQRLVLEWKYIDQLSVREIAGRMATTEKSVEAILFRARREFRDGLGRLQRDDVPFRLNGSAKHKNGSRKHVNDVRSSVSGRTGSDPRSEIEAPQPAGIDEQKQ